MPASPSPEQAAGRLTLENLALDHRDADGQPFRLIDIPLLAIEPGSRFGVSGPSGCGKSSLLHLVAGLLRPSQGRILWNDRAVSELSESGRDRWRRETIGFVFQDFHLIPELERIRQAQAEPGRRGVDLDAEEFFTTPERIGEFSCDAF